MKGKRVWVAGHRGMVGSAVVRRLAGSGAEVIVAGRADADLVRQDQVESWMAKSRPQAVVLAAARVGGIVANDTRPAEFIYENLMIEANVIHAAWKTGVDKLLFLGSTCIYPRLAPQPLNEDALLTGPLEPTNEWYAIAKIAGIKLCQAYRKQHGARFIAAMPTNLYGPHDNFDLKHSHVVGALMVKIHRAKQSGARSVEIWGTGTPKREFLHVDDCADACVFLLQNYDAADIVNIGVGTDMTIREFAETLAKVIGWSGEFVYDRAKPDGTPRKLVDTGRINGLGWRARIGLEDGLRDAYAWFLANAPEAKSAA
ncbi:MAG: GDP-L-fucose synthase [Alphaproteobacteria bacterium]|nr:GDP-L-fucose synthase [Alphaproteobacteria bacterium]